MSNRRKLRYLSSSGYRQVVQTWVRRLPGIATVGYVGFTALAILGGSVLAVVVPWRVFTLPGRWGSWLRRVYYTRRWRNPTKAKISELTHSMQSGERR